MKTLVPFTFAAVAQLVAEHGWRPFPGLQTSKTPALKGWSGLNNAEWDNADLAATITEYQPADLYCCCLAAQPEIVALDADIVDPKHAAYANELADAILAQHHCCELAWCRSAYEYTAPAISLGHASSIPSKFSVAQANLLPLVGTRKLVALTAGHTNPRLPSAPIIIRFQR